MPVIFITDAFIFLLVFIVIGFVFYARKREHLIAPWKDVARRPIAMSAAVVLSVYIIIGLLDSLHFHPKLEDNKTSEVIYSTQILSVLDLVLSDLRESTEKTYSLPLASHAFAKEMIDQPNGKQTRDYPRLKYGGAHLDDPETERCTDITKRVVIGLIAGLLVSAIAIAIILLILSKKNQEPLKSTLSKCIKNEMDVPWYAIYITLGFVITTIVCIYSLAQYYHVLGTDKVGLTIAILTIAIVTIAILTIAIVSNTPPGTS
ncbi:MAG: ABC transporter permease, partial [Pseudomonadota bacterium]